MSASAKRLLVVMTALIVELASCHRGVHGHRVNLTWRATQSNPEATVVGYNVYRRTSPATPYVRIATGIPGTAFEDRLVNSGTTYFYVVTAVDQRGRESGYSTVIRAEVP